MDAETEKSWHARIEVQSQSYDAAFAVEVEARRKADVEQRKLNELWAEYGHALASEMVVAGPCEEASVLSRDAYIPCAAPATGLVFHRRDRRVYRMCPMCLSHNVANRRGVDVTGSARR